MKVKNIQLFCFLTFVVFLVSCGNSTSPSAGNEDATAQNDTSKNANVPSPKVEKIWSKDDFEAFWVYFKSKTEDKNYLLTAIDFPYGNGFETITKAEFENPDGKYFIAFHEQTEIIFSMLNKDGYLNGNLARLFKERFGDLADIYVVRHEDLPVGYYAYFKYYENTFKLIGFEGTQDASH